MQKAGMGLYLHNRLHTQKNIPSSSDTPAIGQNAIGCTCIDDFYLPFVEAPEQLVKTPCTIRIEFVASLISFIPSSSKFFHSLRGPPLKA
jgi:hypothetical protein